MVTFFYLLQGTMDLMYNIAFFQLIFTFFFSTFCKELQASGVAWFMATFLYLIFLLFKQVNFCKELRTSGSGWLHDSILSPPSFLGRIKDLKCRMVTFVYLISTFFFQHFLPQVQDGYIFLPQFYLLFRTLSARNHGPQAQVDYIPKKTPRKQFANCLRTFNNFYLPPPICRVPCRGVRRGVRGDISLTDVQPPRM